MILDKIKLKQMRLYCYKFKILFLKKNDPAIVFKALICVLLTNFTNFTNFTNLKIFFILIINLFLKKHYTQYFLGGGIIGIKSVK